MIQHAQVIAAVQASGDKEYLDWVAEPDDYAATPVENALLDKHVLLQVMPGHTSHPMHFLMAMERESGQAFVVTGQPAAVGRLIRSEPRLAAASDLPRQHVLGLSSDVKEQEKDDYVKTQMDEEKDAHATTYIALMQSGKESDPAAGYTEFYKQIKKDHADWITDEKWDEIRKVALEFLENKYRNVWGGSKTGLNYYEKWEKYHDDNH